MTLARRRRRRVLLLAAALAVTPGLLLRHPERLAAWLVVKDAPVQSDAVLVMAGDPDYERTRTAVGLVLAGRARLLVLTGGEAGPGDSADDLLEHALSLGVAREQVRIERTSDSTRSSLVAVRPILSEEGVETLTLVTSPYHQRRAFLAARRALPDTRIYNWPAESWWSPEDWWRSPRARGALLHEYGALAYYGFRGWL
jgi:uncharacterized SAM-binding protein YcdF (DUF218 family)